MTRKPNLFIIGAMKSGTTSLHNYLNSHPQIFMSQSKEPEYFSSSDNSKQAEKEYLNLFREATDELYIGESSTAYSKMPWKNNVAQKIYNYSPQAKIIYILRDPLQRIISQYKHMIKTHYEVRSLIDMITYEHDHNLSISYYAYQITPYIELFGLESIYIDTLEAFNSSPEQFCQSLFSWLGVDSCFIPPNLNQKYHESSQTIKIIDVNYRVGKIVHKIAREKSFNLGFKWFPLEQIKSLVPKKTLDFKSEEFQKEIELVKIALADIFMNWTNELEELTGKSFARYWSPYEEYRLGTVPANFGKKIDKKLRQISN